MKPPSPQSWEGHGLCRTEGHPSWWDNIIDTGDDDVPESQAHRHERHEKAKAICKRCPVQDYCAAATNIETDDGIRFGELVPDVKARMAHRKKIQFEIVAHTRRAS